MEVEGWNKIGPRAVQIWNDDIPSFVFSLDQTLPYLCTLLTYLIEANKEQRALQANSRSRMLRELFHIDLGSQNAAWIV